MAKLVPIGPLTAIVDDADYDRVSAHTWSPAWNDSTQDWTARAKIDGEPGFMHRFILDAPDGMPVDHIDHNRLNNQRHNIRACTPCQSAQNRRGRDGRRFKGVLQHRHRWEARITVNGRKLYLGLFKTQEEAARVYAAAALTYFGEFAYLNFPTPGAPGTPACPANTATETNLAAHPAAARSAAEAEREAVR